MISLGMWRNVSRKMMFKLRLGEYAGENKEISRIKALQVEPIVHAMALKEDKNVENWIN